MVAHGFSITQRSLSLTLTEPLTTVPRPQTVPFFLRIPPLTLCQKTARHQRVTPKRTNPFLLIATAAPITRQLNRSPHDFAALSQSGSLTPIMTPARRISGICLTAVRVFLRRESYAFPTKVRNTPSRKINMLPLDVAKTQRAAAIFRSQKPAVTVRRRKERAALALTAARCSRFAPVTDAIPPRRSHSVSPRLAPSAFSKLSSACSGDSTTDPGQNLKFRNDTRWRLISDSRLPRPSPPSGTPDGTVRASEFHATAVPLQANVRHNRDILIENL